MNLVLAEVKPVSDGSRLSFKLTRLNAPALALTLTLRVDPTSVPTAWGRRCPEGAAKMLRRRCNKLVLLESRIAWDLKREKNLLRY